jgi:predicted alpha/beta-fold hydrolase
MGKESKMIKNWFLLIIAVLLTQVFTFAQEEQQQTNQLIARQQTANTNAQLITFVLESHLMQRRMPYAVILPANYETDKTRKFPIVYLLHGLGGHYNNWMRINEFARFVLTKHQFIAFSSKAKTGGTLTARRNPTTNTNLTLSKNSCPKLTAIFGFSLGKNRAPSSDFRWAVTGRLSSV